MITIRQIKGVRQLIDAIGAGNSDPQAKGPVVVILKLWDGRIVTGSYYRGDEKPDVTGPEDIIWDNEKLNPFVEKVLRDGSGFITETGSDDTVCTLKWQIGSEPTG